MNSVDSLMKKGIRDGVFPGAVLLAASGRRIRFFEAYGKANIFTSRPVRKDTVFDLASLTKPLATALAVMALAERKKLRLHDRVGFILPEFRDSDKADITVEQLLAHVSGLPAYRPYFRELSLAAPEQRKQRLKLMLLNEPLEADPGTRTVYSDLGFMLIQLAVENACGCRLDRFVHEAVYQPLGIRDLFFIDITGPRPDCGFAATESCPWRKKLLEGEVHDENAYSLGGVAGHSGLFGTAGAVFQLLSSLLDSLNQGGTVFSSSLAGRLLRSRKGFERALGFDLPSGSGSSAGRLFNSAEAAGHLGFTGTSFWMALDGSITVILLTNRVHPSRDNDSIREFRPELHNRIMNCI